MNLRQIAKPELSDPRESCGDILSTVIGNIGETLSFIEPEHAYERETQIETDP